MAEGRHLSIVRAEQLVQRTHIGGGGFGKIWRARHRDWGIDVALKMLHGTNDRCMENEELLREARLMNALCFRHIVSLLGLYRDPEEPLGIVMDFMENGSLASLQERVSVPWPLKVRLIHHVALGMNYLHGLQPPLLHLDLNPRNVLLDDGLNAKIADFGLSKLTRIASSQAVSSIGGTIEYLPPEALRTDINQYKPAMATDVYSFGILIWSVLTGKHPYNAGNRALIRILIPENQRPDLNLLPSQGPLEKLEELKELMQECWHNQAEKRPMFADCRKRTEEVFDAHKASTSDAVHRVMSILRDQDSSSSTGSCSDRMHDLSLRDDFSDGIGELRTEQPPRPDSTPLTKALPPLGTGQPAQEETPNYQPAGPRLPGPKSGSSQLDSRMVLGAAAKESLGSKPANQAPGAQVKPLVSGSAVLDVGSIHIQSSKVAGLQIGHGNTMTITRKTKGRKKSKH